MRADLDAGAPTPDAPAMSAEGVRALIGGTMELRDAPGGDDSSSLGTLVGFIARFNEWTEIDSALEGHFLERVAPGAFRKTFREGLGRIRCIFHHGNDAAVGVRVLGPVQVLEERDDGAWCEVPLLDTSYNRDLVPGLRAGLYGMSFRFKAVRQNMDRKAQRSPHNPSGLPERTLTELMVPEFGPTPFAAYAGATAGMRSLTDDVAVEALAARGRIVLPAMDAGNTVAVPGVYWPTTPGGNASGTVTTTISAPGGATRAGVRDRLYERSISFAATHPWAIEPTTLAVICAILQERAAGAAPSTDEIQARLGIRRLDAPDAPAWPDLGDDDEMDDDEAQASPVAVIGIYGPIVPHGGMMTDVSGVASVDGITAQVRAALADPTVQALVFDIDSPGGQASLIPELAAEILAARGQKPMIAVANAMIASAAYWIASACDEIVATPSADVGSIGVYSMHEDLTAAQEKAGSRVTIVTSEGSPHKAEFSPFVKLSDGAEAEMQRRADAIYQDFVGAVAAGRGTTPEDVQDNYGQGRVLMARDALAVGMIDRIDTLDAVLSQLQEGAGAPAPEGAEGADAVTADAPHSAPARRALDPNTLRPKEEPSWRL